MVFCSSRLDVAEVMLLVIDDVAADDPPEGAGVAAGAVGRGEGVTVLVARGNRRGRLSEL